MTHAKLTRRQREIRPLLERGDTQAAVAEALGISVRTVEHHAAEIRRKLGVATTRDLVRARGRANEPRSAV